MAKAIPINREEVKAFYIASGGSSIETSKEFNISAATIRQWVKRYDWPSYTNSIKRIEKGREELKSLEKGSSGNVTHVTTADALSSLLDRKKGETQSALAIATANAAQAASELDGLSALEASRKLSDLSAVMGRLWPEKNDQAVLSVNVLGLSLDAIGSVVPLQSRPVIDIDPVG
jgi:transposase-like protein